MTRFRRRDLRLSFLFAALCLTVWLPVVSVAQTDSVVDQAVTLIKSMMVETGAPGVAVTVGIDGRFVWSEGFGYADLEQRVPVYPAITRFRIGSVSKPMTAVAVAQLYEQDLLDLDAPVQQYVPSFPRKKEGTITTRLLTGHLAGIRHYKGDEFLSLKHYPTVLEGLEIFKDDPLLHPPGSKFSYSSYGWNLVSVVIENASGQDFLGYMVENVFQPMRMDHTTPDLVSPIIENRTRYYARENGQTINAPPVDNSYKWAGGGFLSTSEDLVRFGFAHLQSTILKPETIQMLWTSQRTTDGEETGYGIGWMVGSDSGGRRYARHSGGSVGGTTSFWVFPESGLVVAIIANMTGVRYDDVPGKLADLFSDVNDNQD